MKRHETMNGISYCSDKTTYYPIGELGHVLEAHKELIELKGYKYDIEVKSVTIDYVHVPYDMIDADLDYDEAHYVHIMKHFDNCVESIISERIRSNIIERAKINIYYRVHKDKIEIKRTMQKVRDVDNARIENQTTTYTMLNVQQKM
jgi:hypothetical protein